MTTTPKFSLSRLQAVCLHAGIEVREDSRIPTAAATVSNGRYVILLGDTFRQADEQRRAVLLAHELGHVLRGDLLRLQQGDVDAMVWNIASDAFINATLPVADVMLLNGITYDGLLEQHPSLPAKMPDYTQQLYDLLREQQDENGNGNGDGDGEEGAAAPDTLESDGSMTQETHARTVLKARAAAREHGVELDAPMAVRKDMPSPQPWHMPPSMQRLIEALQIAARHTRGALVRTRTYARPGRVQGLRGVHRAPRLHVALALDVSGSMTHWLPHMQAAAAAFKREFDVSLYVWADRLAAYSAESQPDVGYGTDPSNLRELAHRHDAAVVITDGEFDRSSAQAAADALPCVWLIVENGTTENLPAGARVVKEGS